VCIWGVTALPYLGPGSFGIPPKAPFSPCMQTLNIQRVVWVVEGWGNLARHLLPNLHNYEY